MSLSLLIFPSTGPVLHAPRPTGSLTFERILPVARRRRSLTKRNGARGMRLCQRLADLADQAILPLHCAKQDIGAVAQHMPAIRDLASIWRTFSGAARISAAAITGDDFVPG